MNLEEYENLWHSEAHGKVHTDRELLEKIILERIHDYDRNILRRNLREIIAGFLMIPAFIVIGVFTRQPWSWYLIITAIVWLIGFILVDRHQQNRRRGGPADSFSARVEQSIVDLRHDIWLLKRVVYWYLLPFYVTICGYFIHLAILGDKESLLFSLLLLVFVTALYTWVWYINQQAVKKDRLPRLKELIEIQRSLHSEVSSTGKR